MLPQDRVIQRAKNEVGYLEKISNYQLDEKTANYGTGNWTKYARDLDGLGNIYNGIKNGYDWCDIFVDWCFITEFGTDLGMKLLCQAYNGCGAGVGWSLRYYDQKGQYFAKGQLAPQPGDQIFFQNNGTPCHTGIVVAVTSSTVTTIEGNTCTSNSAKQGVYEKSYGLNASYILGYGRPNWSLVPIETPKVESSEPVKVDSSLVEDALIGLEADKRKLTGSSWSAEARNALVTDKIFAGDGQGNYGWEWYVTKEELAAALYNMVKQYGLKK